MCKRAIFTCKCIYQHWEVDANLRLSMHDITNHTADCIMRKHWKHINWWQLFIHLMIFFVIGGFVQMYLVHKLCVIMKFGCCYYWIKLFFKAIQASYLIKYSLDPSRIFAACTNYHILIRKGDGTILQGIVRFPE